MESQKGDHEPVVELRRPPDPAPMNRQLSLLGQSEPVPFAQVFFP